MVTEVPSQQDLYNAYKNEVQARAPVLTDWVEGSKNDSMAGAVAVAGQEVLRLIISKFNKTFLATAHGPEVTGDADDLEFLAVDHWGDSFARPGATPAIGTVTFSRPNTDNGNVLIPAGTIVKTDKDANGEEQRFATLSDVTMTGLSINASVQAVVAGDDGNVNADTVINIEDALTDPTVEVTNALAFAGGDNEYDDAEYREFIRNRIEIIRGATKAAIEAAANLVPGVEIAIAMENLKTVIEWNIGTGTPIGSPFKIIEAKLYIADINGAASQALIDAVVLAIDPIRACGVKIEVIGAVAVPLDWSAMYSLNVSGPNFAALSVDSTLIEESMAQYLQNLSIGDDFDRSVAKAAILAIWGPSGTNDLTDFVINTPIANVVTGDDQKLVPGTMTAGV